MARGAQSSTGLVRLYSHLGGLWGIIFYRGAHADVLGDVSSLGEEFAQSVLEEHKGLEVFGYSLGDAKMQVAGEAQHSRKGLDQHLWDVPCTKTQLSYCKLCQKSLSFV